MADPLMNVPGLAGFLSAQQHGQRQQAGQLQQMGALQGILAQAQKQQAMQGALAKEQAFKQELSALGPNPDQTMLAQIAAKYSPAADVLKTQQASADRGLQREMMTAEGAARREQATALQGERLTAQADAIRQRAEDQRLTAQERNQARMDLAKFMVANRAPAQPRADQPLVSIIDADGKPKLVRREDAVGATPYTPRTDEKPPRALPPSVANKYIENIQNLRKADIALNLLEGRNVGTSQGDTESTGKKGLLSNLGVLGDKTLNALDPKGVDTRAAIGDLGSMVIHDRSGAAVTAAEFPRLRPFIPLASDAPDVAVKKVRRFKQEYEAEVEAQKEFFSASGYKVPEIGASGVPARRKGDVAGASAVPAPPPGFKLVD